MTESVLSSDERLSISDWGPVLFPRDRSGQLLAFYMDDSSDQKQQQVFVVAGFLGDTTVWFYGVERHWNARLKKDGIDYFRAAEYNSMSGQFEKLKERYKEAAAKVADELVTDLKLIIKTSDLGAFCFMGPMELYRNARAAEYGELVLEKNPFFKGHEQIIYQVAKSAGQHGISGPIAFVIDENMQSPAFVANWGAFKRNHPTTSKWMGSITAMDDKTCVPLQVADLIANTTKKAYQSRWQDPNAGLAELQQWSRNLMWVGYWNEEYLTALVDSAIDAATSPTPIPSRRLEDL
jgi:hypothetical protein